MDWNLLTGFKEVLGSVAIVLTFVAFIPYIRSILKGHTRPHVFSWLIWGMTTFIVFLAQLSDKGGAGAWSIGVSGIITLMIAALAYMKRSDTTITRIDWVFLLVSLAALPLWYITSNPLWAVVILTTIDLIGFLPSLRKAYFKPFEEQLLLYVLMAVRNMIAIMALEHYSLTTLLFPLAIGIACILFVGVVYVRRQVVK